MLSLPRGAFKGAHNVKLSTAEWARPSTIARLAYDGGGALFLGAAPYEEVWPKLLDLQANVAALQTDIEARAQTQHLTPIARANALRELEAIWLRGMLADCMPLGLSDDRHFVTIAGARSGKGQSAIIPNLCLYPGSVVCLDPKGENASLTAARRGQGDAWSQGLGQEVYVLDPFDVAQVPQEMRASLNPLALLDVRSPLVVDDAALLAEGLILSEGEGNDHWSETARNLVKGIILHLISTHNQANKPPTLFDVRRMLTNGDKPGFEAAKARRQKYLLAVEDAKAAFEQHKADDPDAVFVPPPRPPGLLPDSVRSAFMYLLWCMEQNPAFEGVVAGTAESILGTGDNERGSTLSTARRNTAFLDSAQHDPITGQATPFSTTLQGLHRPLNPETLKSDPRGVTVYLCLPAERMGTHGRWLRLMVGLLLERMQRQLMEPASKAPVLFLLEEFFALGTMPAIEKAAGYAAGFGVKLWAVLQDLQQLKSLYRTSWQTFLANAGAVQIFGASDKDTLDYAANALGEFEVTRVLASVSENSTDGQSQGSELNKYGPAWSGSAKNLPMAAAAFLFRGMLDDTSHSGGHATTASHNTSLHVVPLLRPDEIAQQFARESGASLLLIKGHRPVWCLRCNYNESPWFAGCFTPLDKYQQATPQGQTPWPFWQRPPTPFKDVVQAFNALSQRIANPAQPPQLGA